MDTYPELRHENKNYTLAYVRVDDFVEESYINKFLQLLGGQVHVKCDVHKLPLIISRQKKAVVIGNIIICVVVYQHARFCMCKKCFKAYDQTIINNLQFLSGSGG